MLRLLCFGGLSLERGGDPVPPDVAQPLRLALLAVLSTTPDREIRRDKLLALFWPEADQRRAAAALAQALYVLRRDLGGALLVGRGQALRINQECLTSDVAELEAHLSRGNLADAVAWYAGPFLDGFHLAQSPAFEQWVDVQRGRHSASYAESLRSLATAADKRGDHANAVKWWRMLASADPLNTRTAVALVGSLADSGDRAGALQHAADHQAMLREELGLDQDAALAALAAQIRVLPSANSGSVVVAPRQTEATAGKSGQAQDSADEALSTAPHPHDRLPVEAPPKISIATAWRRPLLVWGTGLATLTASLWIRTDTGVASNAGSAGSMDVVAIMPFEVSGDSSAWYLREGMPTLISAKLTGAGGVRAVEPGLVLRSWHAAPAGLLSWGPDPKEFQPVARRVGASMFVEGNVVAARERLHIRAKLVQVRDSALRAEMAVDGPPDSLTSLVDRLVAQLLLGDRGETGPRLASLTSTSLPALQAYLAGQEAYRRGDYQRAVHAFRVAVAADSTFALANFGLGLALGFAGLPDDGAPAVSAWAWRSKLSEPDRLFLGMFTGNFTGPRTTQTEYKRGWERALHAAPERPELWYHVGDMFFHGGDLYAPESPNGSARTALTRSLDLDSLFAPAMLHLFQLDAHVGDTIETARLGRRYIAANPTGDLAPYVRWRLAHTLGNAMAVSAARAAIDTMPWPSLRAIIMTSQFDGVAPDDAAKALDARMRRAATSLERYEAWLLLHGLALNRGRPAEALAATRGIEELRSATDEHLRLRVLDALYGDGDTTAAKAAAAELERHGHWPATDADALTRAYRDLCVLEQWRLRHGVFEHTKRTIEVLAHSAVTRGSTEDTENVGCSVVLDTWLAIMSNSVGSHAKLARLDSLVEDGPGMEDLLSYLPLARARLHMLQGDVHGALHAARRRFYMAYYPHYLASHLAEEARDAARVGNWDGAARAYHHVLTLRGSSDVALADQVAAMRNEYEHALREQAIARSASR